MSKRRPSSAASVLIGDRRVGTIEFSKGDSWFLYEDIAADHPVLGQRFEDDPSYGREVARGGVPVWFANLLPERESGLRQLINRDLGVLESHDFKLLLHLGEDLPGAVRVVPQGDSTEMPPPGTGISAGGSLGFSLSGMQLKFSMIRDGSRFVLPEHGRGGNWIVKLPSHIHSRLPLNEFWMMTWADRVGIDVPEHTLVSPADIEGIRRELLEGGEQLYAIRRFDREPGGRVHQEDFAQILDVRPHNKGLGSQELLAQVVSSVCPPEDYDELIRRIVFCIACGNTDEHLKNWSLRYPDGRAARLSPSYDLVSSTPYPRFRKSQMTLSIAGQRDVRYIDLDHFRRLADQAGADEVATVECVERTIGDIQDRWVGVKSEGGLPAFISDHVTERLSTLPLMRL